MRTLALFGCSVALGAALVAGASGAEPNVGTLSVEGGRGVVVLDLRGSVLGRLAGGTLRVTDQTPNDRFVTLVFGRKVTQEQIGSRTVVYRGLGLRFRMLGGAFRVVIRGNGIDLSAVGRGAVTLDGEPRSAGDDIGAYSLVDGVDCGEEPELCLALPTEPERFVLGARSALLAGPVTP
jgi:hypothetical protein